MNRSAIIVCERLVGVPFAKGGRSYAAADCWGLLRLAYRDMLGIELPILGVAADSDRSLVERQVTADQWQAVEPGHEQPGDVVTLRADGWPAHVGMVVGGRRMLHVVEGASSRIERYDSRIWTSRIDGFYRHPRRAAVR